LAEFLNFSSLQTLVHFKLLQHFSRLSRKTLTWSRGPGFSRLNKQTLYLGRWGVHPSVDFLAANKPAKKNWGGI